MASGLPAGYALPKPQIPKLAGTLCIVFGALLLAWGALGLAMSVLTPYLMGYLDRQISAQVEKEEAERARRVAELEAKEKEAESAQEKSALKAQRDALAANPAPSKSAVNKMMLIGQDRRIGGVQIGGQVLALGLDAMMLAAGIGLLGLKEWARRLGLWTGGLKLALAVAVCVATILVVIPVQTKAMRDAFLEDSNPMSQAQANQMVRISGIYGSAAAVFSAVLSSIWPVILVAMLTRPGAKAACLAPKVAPKVAPNLAWEAEQP